MLSKRTDGIVKRQLNPISERFKQETDRQTQSCYLVCLGFICNHIKLKIILC